MSPRHHKGNSSRGALKSRLRWLRAPATSVTGTLVPLERGCWFARLIRAASSPDNSTLSLPSSGTSRTSSMSPRIVSAASVRVSSALRASRSLAIFSRYTVATLGCSRATIAQWSMVLHHQDYHLRGCVTQTQPKTNARWASVVDPKAENGCLKRSGAGPWRKSLASSRSSSAVRVPTNAAMRSSEQMRNRNLNDRF